MKSTQAKKILNPKILIVPENDKMLDKIMNLFKKKENRTHFTSAIIVAGGNGTRIGGEIPKQHLPVCGKEIVVHAMLAFEECPLIDEIIPVCREGEQIIYDDYKIKYGITKLKAAVVGGDTRQESVLRGFEHVNRKCEYVAIHDGVRCLITPEDIENVIRTAYEYRAATASSSAVDTVKIADSNKFIESTPDRSLVYQASTHQVFEHKLYTTRAYSALKDGVSVTDDNALAERLGFKVKLVETNSINIKVTRPDDISIAEAILTKRENNRI